MKSLPNVGEKDLEYWLKENLLKEQITYTKFLEKINHFLSVRKRKSVFNERQMVERTISHLYLNHLYGVEQDYVSIPNGHLSLESQQDIQKFQNLTRKVKIYTKHYFKDEFQQDTPVWEDDLRIILDYKIESLINSRSSKNVNTLIDQIIDNLREELNVQTPPLEEISNISKMMGFDRFITPVDLSIFSPDYETPLAKYSCFYNFEDFCFMCNGKQYIMTKGVAKESEWDWDEI